MELSGIDQELNKVSELLTTIWTKTDDEILAFLSRNKNFLDRNVQFICIRSYGVLCEDCEEKGLLCGCKDCHQMVCCCARELEALPLSVDDKQQLRRLCINAYVGACPHAVSVFNGDSGLVTASFLQHRMADYYVDPELDLNYNADVVKSSSLVLFRRTDVLLLAGSYLEHILLRIGKIRLLSTIMNDHFPKKKRFRRTFKHGCTVLQLALHLHEIEFFMSDFKQKTKRGKGTLLNNCRMIMCEFSRLENDNILNLSMSTNSLKAFCKTLKALKKIQGLDRFRTQQKLLQRTLWTSVIDSKVEYTRILLQSNTINFKPLYNPSGEGYKELGLSKLIKNDNNEVVDMLLYYPGFHTYIPKLMCFAISYGKLGMCQQLIRAFNRFYKGEKVKAIDVYTLAVLQDNTEVLKILIDHKVPTFHMDQVKFSALDFAICFQRENHCQMLRRAGHESLEDTADTSPLLELQKLEDYSYPYHRKCTRTLPLVKLIEELIILGFNVYFDDQNGITPVQMAIKRQDYDTVRVLLKNGADLFRGQSLMVQYGTMRLLTEIFYCNVDIFDHISTIVNVVRHITHLPRGSANWALQKIDREQLTYAFITDCIHSHSTLDRAALTRYYKEFDSQHNMIRPLGQQCRERLRRHFGRHIHGFVNKITIPESIKRFILLLDEIDTFQSMIRWKLNNEYCVSLY